MLSKTRAALTLGIALPLLHACGLDDVNQGHVRVLNATTEYSTLSLYDIDSKNDSNQLISGTPADTASNYANLDSGTYTFQVLGSGASSAAATSTSTSITKTDYFTVVASISGTTSTAQVLTENEVAPTSGNAKLRIYNAAPTEVGGVDVYITSHDCTALDTTDAAFATSVSTLQSTYGQILAASTGTTWNICVTGSGNQADLRLIGSQTFSAGQIDTLVLSRTSGGVLLNGQILEQQGPATAITNTLSRLRIVSDAAGGNSVSATVNGAALATLSPAQTIGPYNAVTAGTPTVSLSIGGTAITAPTMSFVAGADYTLLIAGTAAAPTVQLITDSNTPSTSTALPVKMRMVNGLNGLTSAASLTSDGTSVTDGLAFGEASTPYTNVAASTSTASTIQVSAAGTSLSSFTQTLTSGTVYTLFLLGDYSAATPTTGFSATLRADRSPTDSTSGTSSSSSSSTSSGN